MYVVARLALLYSCLVAVGAGMAAKRMKGEDCSNARAQHRAGGEGSGYDRCRSLWRNLQV